MADIIELTNLTIDPTKYFEVKNLNAFNDDQSIQLKVVSDKNGNLYLQSDIEIYGSGTEKKFFRSISFLTCCSHPIISKLKGFSFIDPDLIEFAKDTCNFTILSEYPENGFLMEFMEKVEKGVIRGFDNTAKSKYIFGAAFVGQFLHSRNIVHRCFAPPSFGVTKDFEPILMTLSSSKTQGRNINETVLTNCYSWNAPETDDDKFETDQNYHSRADVFSFGSLIYYLYTGKKPFYDKHYKRLIENKNNPALYINNMTDAPDNLKKLVEECWAIDPSLRPSFDQIILQFQCHESLFQDTNMDEFDLYVKKLFSYDIQSPICKIASQNEKLINSVNVVYQSVMDSYVSKHNLNVLKSLDIIRMQTESYIPLLLHVSRPGTNYNCWVPVSSFMFVTSLFGEINRLFDVPENFLKVEVNNNMLIDKPWLTMEQLNIETGSSLIVYNTFAAKALGSNLLNLDIQHFGKVHLFYIKTDTIRTLKYDISFSTRIPIDTLELEFNGRKLSEEDDDKTLEELKINPNDLIKVNTELSNDPFKLTVGIIDKTKTITTRVTPIMKITDMMEDIGINTLNCYATYNKDILNPYKAFIDYYITTPTTIMIHVKTLRK